MALKPPETPEEPGWCGQGAIRDQHGPALSGVASQRPNRLRGLSVEGRCLSRDCGERQCRTAQTNYRQCQAQGEGTPKEGGAISTTERPFAAAIHWRGACAATKQHCAARPDKTIAYDGCKVGWLPAIIRRNNGGARRPVCRGPILGPYDRRGEHHRTERPIPHTERRCGEGHSAVNWR